MLSSEIAWIEQLFETHSANVTSFLRDEVGKLHKRLDVAHDKLNTVIVAASHIIEGNKTMAADHAQILADLKAFDAELDTKVDAAVSEFDSFVATHTAVKDSLDDIAEIVAGLPAKAAKLDAIKEPTDASTSTQQPASGTDTPTASAPVTATVSAPTTAGTTSIPVDQTSATAASTALGNAIQSGSTVAVSGPGVADGTTLEGVDNSSLHLSQPTTADHTGDGSETVTVTPAA